MSTSSTIRFVRSAEAKIKIVGASTAVYVPASKAIHVLNPTAQLLFELLEEPTTESELCEALIIATNGDRATIVGDVAEAVADFVAKGIIEPDSSG